ncbi:hypothetical protein D5S17_07380 [Pseudonocardiaceae bacterium YIM PH 21723]|nr:hypothetical protein D5S17_07380 [Pseudonocardiaceae bacterium YIM PH 21723]
MSRDDEWYFCLKHNTAEPGAGCRSVDRLGPYPDKATAERALEIARERTKAEDAKDRKDSWDED